MNFMIYFVNVAIKNDKKLAFLIILKKITELKTTPNCRKCKFFKYFRPESINYTLCN